MSVRPFVPWPDPRLSKACSDVGTVDDEVREIWRDMIDTMEAMPGLGLAACQIGVLRKLAVVDCSETRGQAIRLADPQVIEAAEEFSEVEEASPNLPSVAARIRRPAWVRVRFRNAENAVEEQRFEGLWATSVQHQIDHLAGRMYFDRLSRTRRQMLLRRAEKLRRGSA